MDENPLSEKHSKTEFGSRWHRIERKHINTIHHGHRNGASNTFCRNILNSKTFVKEHQMKRLMSDETKRWCLDPNLVMNLRHEKIKRRKCTESIGEPKSPPMHLNGYTTAEINEQAHFRQVEYLNRELSKYKECLESLRPKSKHPTSQRNGERNCRVVNVFEEEIESVSAQNLPAGSRIASEFVPLGNSGGKFDAGDMDTYSEPVDLVMSSPAVSRRPTPPFKEYAEIDTITRPALKFSIQESLSVSQPNIDGVNTVTEIMSKEILAPNHAFDRTLSLDHHMSIFIRRLDLCDSNTSFHNGDVHEDSGPSEKATIINALFDRKQRENRNLLQKYFMRWVHFNTIEKLTKRNPDQTRLRKMETFLQNITLERKKTLQKLKAINRVESTPYSPIKPKFTTDSPELLARKFNNKLKIQQDIIELQKLKLKRQERVIAEMKLSRLLEDTDESQGEIKADLKFVARKGCQKSRSKARCLQIAGNLKDPADDSVHDVMQAKGLTAPKFLVEMQARALEREMKHRQAQERREQLEREKEEMRLAAEDAKRLEDEAAKRQRIDELRRKRHEEKQRKIQNEMERLKYIANVERAKQFERFRVLKWVFRKFRNLIRWKKRNEQLAKEFWRTETQRKFLLKWKERVNYVWDERKKRADRHYERHCMTMTFKLWQKYFLAEHGKWLVAVDWYDMRISERWFRVWNLVTAQRRMVYEMKEKQAEAHYGWHLKWRVLDHWRRLQVILKIEKETEERRERWRHKIYELLPDYTPNRDDYL